MGGMSQTTLTSLSQNPVAVLWKPPEAWLRHKHHGPDVAPQPEVHHAARTQAESDRDAFQQQKTHHSQTPQGGKVTQTRVIPR